LPLQTQQRPYTNKVLGRYGTVACLKTVEGSRDVLEQPVDVVDDDDGRPAVQPHVRERRLLDGVENARQPIAVVALRHRVDVHEDVDEEPEADVLVEAEADGGAERLGEAVSLVGEHVDRRAETPSTVLLHHRPDHLDHRPCLSGPDVARYQVVLVGERRLQNSTQGLYNRRKVRCGEMSFVTLAASVDIGPVTLEFMKGDIFCRDMAAI